VPRNLKSAKEIGDVLRSLREKAQLTQDDIAVRTRLDRSYISDIERGAASVSVDCFLQICRALGASPAKTMAQVEKRLISKIP
jgi:transcriptional regulator with XRE-family HTH domain